MSRTMIGMLVILLCIVIGTEALAHESQPGTLELRQVAQDRYEVIWRAPICYGQPHPARLELPEKWKTVVEPTMRLLADSQVVRRIVTVGNQGIEGSIIRFPGLENTITDVFVRLNWLEYDASALVAERPFHSPILVDQGAADRFLDVQLNPEVFADACRRSGQAFELRVHPGYDPGYYFIQTFMADHLAWHARALMA